MPTGTRLPAAEFPAHAVVVTIHTRRLGVVLQQLRGYACLLDFGDDRPVYVHPNVVLEAAPE